MASLHQQNISDYHRSVASVSHHGGHNMHIFHRDWHRNNRNPVPPSRPDTNWGMNLVVGTNFLQMHHEMLKAAMTEQRFHMMHESLLDWYQQNGKQLPVEWNPLSAIPDELDYEPDLNEFPLEIQQGVQQIASARRISPEQFLTRTTNNPQFTLPRWFTREGVAAGEPGELFTGARKLADFRNTNQLGCCLVFPHDSWHGAIGGAIGSTWTAIADPIFYFGIHWYVDRIYDEYKLIQAERVVRPLDRQILRGRDVLETEERGLSSEFSLDEKEIIRKWLDDSQQFNQELL